MESRKRSRASEAEEGAKRAKKKKKRSSGEREAAASFAPLAAQSSAVGTSGWQGEDKELWLIKLPQGMDVAELDGKKCELGVTGGKQTSRSAIKLSDGRVVGLQPSAPSSQYLSSFVCNSEKRWVVGKPFAREINVVQRFDFGSNADSCPKINVPVPMHVLEKQKTRNSAAVGGTTRTTTTRESPAKLGKAKKAKKSAKKAKAPKSKKDKTKDKAKKKKKK